MFPVHGDSKTCNISDLLRNNIMQSSYFQDLYKLRGPSEISDEIVEHVKSVEPWTSGTTGLPSTLFCCLYKLMTMKLTEKQVF